MKKQYVSLLAIILSVSGFLFSCHDKMNKNTGALQFDSIQVNETAHLFNDTAKPACNIIINFAYPVKSSDDMLKDSLNAYFISACFGDKYIGEKPENVVKQYTENYISEYRRDLEPMYTEDEKDKEDESSIGAWYSYYKGIESHVQLYEKDLLVYRIDYNEYTGGAHGIYMTTYLNMDLTLMRPLRLDDIFVGDFTCLPATTRSSSPTSFGTSLWRTMKPRHVLNWRIWDMVRQEKSRRQRISISAERASRSTTMYTTSLHTPWAPSK